MSCSLCGKYNVEERERRRDNAACIDVHVGLLYNACSATDTLN